MWFVARTTSPHDSVTRTSIAHMLLQLRPQVHGVVQLYRISSTWGSSARTSSTWDSSARTSSTWGSAARTSSTWDSAARTSCKYMG